MDKRTQLINALTELKNASMLFKSNPTILDKYKIMFCDTDCKILDTPFLEDSLPILISPWELLQKNC